MQPSLPKDPCQMFCTDFVLWVLEHTFNINETRSGLVNTRVFAKYEQLNFRFPNKYDQRLKFISDTVQVTEINQ